MRLVSYSRREIREQWDEYIGCENLKLSYLCGSAKPTGQVHFLQLTGEADKTEEIARLISHGSDI